METSEPGESEPMEITPELAEILQWAATDPNSQVTDELRKAIRDRKFKIVPIEDDEPFIPGQLR